MAQDQITQFKPDFPANEYRVLIDSEDEEELRQISKPIDPELIKTEQFKKFVKVLYDSMMKYKLKDGWMHAGISAIQVGEPIRLFYAYNTDTEDYELYINPEVEIINAATDVKEEGCLSVPDKTDKVQRYKKVRVKYHDKDGNRTSKRLKDWDARVVQHENDHLDGILFTDKLYVQE